MGHLTPWQMLETSWNSPLNLGAKMSFSRHRREFLDAEGSCLELAAIDGKGLDPRNSTFQVTQVVSKKVFVSYGPLHAVTVRLRRGFGLRLGLLVHLAPFRDLRTKADIEAGCCLLAEPPLVFVPLDLEILVCEHCLSSMHSEGVTCGCTTFCSPRCLTDAMAAGHRFLCHQSAKAQQLVNVFDELHAVGEAFRLAVKLLALCAAQGCRWEHCRGLHGMPWWDTAGLSGFEDEALHTTETVLELLHQLLPLPLDSLDVHELAVLVGRVRMPLVFSRPTQSVSEECC